MKIVLNKCYGGFSLSKYALDKLGLTLDDVFSMNRTDPCLIELVEKEPDKVSTPFFANLKVVEIPNYATAWELNEYDGYETITYVVEGKLYHA